MSNYCKNIHFSFFFFSCGVANFLKIAWKMTWFSLCFMRFIQLFSSRQHSCQEQRQADTEYITWIFMNILWFLSSVCSTESPDFILKSFLSSAEPTSRKTIKSLSIAFPVCQNKLILWFLKSWNYFPSKIFLVRKIHQNIVFHLQNMRIWSNFDRKIFCGNFGREN